MIAAVMAGGKATRFRDPVEKGLLRVGGKMLLERSLSALGGSGMEEVIATSPHTPVTREYAASLGMSIFETSGRGYHEDVLELLAHFGNLVTLNVDVPFLRKEDVRCFQMRIGDDSLAAVIPAAKAIRKPHEQSTLMDSERTAMVWVGLNFVTPRPDVSFVVLDEPLLSVNINDESDLDFADSMAKKRGI